MIPFRRVGIVGLGVIGGSLARALRALPDPPRVFGFSPDPSERAAALEVGAVDEAPAESVQVAEGSDLVVYAVPPRALGDLLSAHRDAWGDDAVVTDTASLKGRVVEQVRDLGIADRWVGSHPMAGSEASGFAASVPGLFRGRRVWLVAVGHAASDGSAPPDGGGAEGQDTAEGAGGQDTPEGSVGRLWTAVGGRPERIDPEVHDRLMTAVSHLPQLASLAVATLLAREGVDSSDLGPGGRDVTRLAGSAPALWRDLLDEAAAEDGRLLTELARIAEEMASELERGRADATADRLDRTGRWRRGEAWS